MKNMHFERKLPVPGDIKVRYPLTEELCRVKRERDELIADTFTGKSRKKVLVIGPCSADREDAALITDTNHSNSAKKYQEQPRICNGVLHACRHSGSIRSMVKGFMSEFYPEEGSQKIGEGIYGKSITDPCIGWQTTEHMVPDIAEQI